MNQFIGSNRYWIDLTSACSPLRYKSSGPLVRAYEGLQFSDLTAVEVMFFFYVVMTEIIQKDHEPLLIQDVKKFQKVVRHSDPPESKYMAFIQDVRLVNPQAYDISIYTLIQTDTGLAFNASTPCVRTCIWLKRPPETNDFRRRDFLISPPPFQCDFSDNCYGQPFR